MKSTLLACIAVFFVFQLSAQAFDPDENLRTLSGKKSNIGIAAGYAVDGKIEWMQADGFTCEDSSSPFTSTTVTRIASIAKNFTAVAIM